MICYCVSRCALVLLFFHAPIARETDSSGVCFEDELREAIKTVLGRRHAGKQDDQVVRIQIGVGASPEIQILVESPSSEVV